MKKISPWLMGIFMGSFLTVNVVRGQAINSTSYTFSTIAGVADGTTGSSDGTGSGARFYWPEGIAADNAGNLYVADTFNNTIRKLTPAGTNWVVSTIAGTAGSFGADDGTSALARFNSPSGLAMDKTGNLYVADTGNHTIRKLTPVGTNWVVSTIAGSAGNFGFNDGTNLAAQFFYPSGIAVDANTNLYVADTDNEDIRKLTPVGTNWVVSTIAGATNGDFGAADGVNNAALFYGPSGIAVDNAGNLYVTDTGNNTIRKIRLLGTNWVTSTIAGTAGSSGSNDGTNATAQFNGPFGISVDKAGNLFVADSGNNTIREIAPSGTNWATSTLGGIAGTDGHTDGVGANALFYDPSGVAVDGAGNLYVADTLNGTIRMGQTATINPTAPKLTIRFVAPNSVVVSWADVSGYTLQTNQSLTTPNWVNYGGTVTTANGTNSVTISPLQGALFFRLNGGVVVSVPNLAIRFVAPNSIVVSWPDTGSYTLQTNQNLTTSNWADYGGTVATANGTNSITISSPTGNLFFRLSN
jgi:ribosomal protein S11